MEQTPLMHAWLYAENVPSNTNECGYWIIARRNVYVATFNKKIVTHGPQHNFLCFDIVKKIKLVFEKSSNTNQWQTNLSFSTLDTSYNLIICVSNLTYVVQRRQHNKLRNLNYVTNLRLFFGVQMINQYHVQLTETPDPVLDTKIIMR